MVRERVRFRIRVRVRARVNIWPNHPMIPDDTPPREEAIPKP